MIGRAIPAAVILGATLGRERGISSQPNGCLSNGYPARFGRRWPPGSESHSVSTPELVKVP